MVRRAAWSDRFYPAKPAVLSREVEKYLAPEPDQNKISRPIACVAPHAAIMYSGAIAGAAYARLEMPERFIILCPNHTGRGTPLSIMPEGKWQMPFGDVPIDSALAAALMRKCHLLFDDAQAH